MLQGLEIWHCSATDLQAGSRLGLRAMLFENSRYMPANWRIPHCSCKRHAHCYGVSVVSRHQAARELIQRNLPRQSSKISKEDQAYWEKVAESIDKPTALLELKRLDLRYPAGIPPNGKSVRIGRKAEAATMPQLAVEYKRQHPQKVILIRIGHFYEAFGLDAVVLMQFCSLNPMAARSPPQAGTQYQNIARTVRDLVVENGFSVVVLEEAKSGYSQKRKDRFVGGIMTPAQPEYLHGQVDAKGDLAKDTSSATPILGVASSVGGYTIIEVNADLRTYAVAEGRTEDAVSSRLYQGSIAPPLYVHCPDTQSGTFLLTEATAENQWIMRISQFMKCQAGVVKKYSSTDPVQGLLDLVKRDQGLPANTVFKESLRDKRTRPKEVFNSTASQLGILPTKGVPSLLDALLAPTTSLLQRQYMKSLLLAPPPAEVAANISRACHLLSELTIPLPRWLLLDARQVIRLLEKRETNEYFFRDLEKALRAAQDGLEGPGLARLAENLLEAVKVETGLSYSMAALLSGCREAADKIEAVVEPPSEHGSGSKIEEEILTLEIVLHNYFLENEDFTGKIKKSLVQTQLKQVAQTGMEVEKAALEAAAVLENQTDLQKNRAVLTHSPLNNTIWFKIPKGSTAHKIATGHTVDHVVFVHPEDRKGEKIVKEYWSSERLERALREYRSACESARQAVRSHLQSLAASLQPELSNIYGAITFNLVAATLESHVREAVQRGWALPQQLPPPTSHAGDATSEVHRQSESMRVQGMWPYWLDARSANTVRNTLDLNSMVILTGANMAGKSTVMRTICAVALLSACGLYAPVEQAVVPYIDAFMLRTFAADSPIERKSSFAIEMSEMNYVMKDVSKDSLVLVDELGKGTEPKTGAAVAAGFLVFLDRVGCRGMFATHLHQLLDMDLKFRNVGYKCMETIDATELGGFETPMAKQMEGFREIALRMGQRVPTWRVIPGTCRHSLALVVMAQHCGIDSPVVADALRFDQELKQQELHLAAGERVEGKLLAKDSNTLEDQLPTYSLHLSSPEAPTENLPNDKQIDEAAAILEDIAQHIFQRLEGSQGNLPPCGEGSSFGELILAEHETDSMNPSSTAQVIHPRMEPPPATVGCSCIYVVRRPDGYFYVGETDELKQRLKQHRAKSSKFKGGPQMEAAYIKVPSSLQGKSVAREVEASAIKALQEAGFHLLSVTDRRNKRPPRAAAMAA